MSLQICRGFSVIPASRMLVQRLHYKGEDSEETVLDDEAKSLCKTYAGNEDRLSLFPLFLLKLSKGENHVNGGPVGTKSKL